MQCCHLASWEKISVAVDETGRVMIIIIMIVMMSRAVN